MSKSTYRYACEYCSGTVRPRVVAREVFRHKLWFVLLENVVSGRQGLIEGSWSGRLAIVARPCGGE
jgi:hypothetical protein